MTEGFKAFVELTPPRHDDRDVFEKTVLEVFWQLTVEEIIAPGVSGNQGGFPRFRVTSHGHRVLADRDYVPHDRQGYLQLLNERVPKPDLTVLAYLDESLQTFARDNLVASTIMLGVAAEREIGEEISPRNDRGDGLRAPIQMPQPRGRLEDRRGACDRAPMGLGPASMEEWVMSRVIGGGRGLFSDHACQCNITTPSI